MLTPSFLRGFKVSQHAKHLGFALVLLSILVAPKWVWPQPYERSATPDKAIKFNTVNSTAGKMHYAYAGDIERPGVLFVHGTPGGWDAFEGYLQNKALREDFFLVSVDRLGWEGSSLPEEQRLDGDFILQSQGILKVMQTYPDKKWIIVGHSLGASLAPQVALDAPTQVSALLLLAGSLSPKLGGPRWYNRAASTWLVSRFIGKMMLDSNREIMGLRKQLKAMSLALEERRLDIKVSVMQGMKDKLVSPKNAAYVDQHWRPYFSTIDIIELPDEGHFLPWRQTPLVIATIRSLAQ